MRTAITLTFIPIVLLSLLLSFIALSQYPKLLPDILIFSLRCATLISPLIFWNFMVLYFSRRYKLTPITYWLFAGTLISMAPFVVTWIGYALGLKDSYEFQVGLIFSTFFALTDFFLFPFITLSPSTSN